MRKPQYQHISLPIAFTGSPLGQLGQDQPPKPAPPQQSRLSHNRRAHAAHRGEIERPEQLTPVTRETKPAGPTKHLLSKTTASRPGDVANTPTTQKQTQLDRTKR